MHFSLEQPSPECPACGRLIASIPMDRQEIFAARPDPQELKRLIGDLIAAAVDYGDATETIAARAALYKALGIK